MIYGSSPIMFICLNISAYVYVLTLPPIMYDPSLAFGGSRLCRPLQVNDKFRLFAVTISNAARRIAESRNVATFICMLLPSLDMF